MSRPSTLPMNSNGASRSAALAGFLADREQSDAWPFDLQHPAGELGAERRELHERLRGHLHVRAGVEQHGHAAASSWNHHGEPRTPHAADALHVEQRGGQRGPGRPGAHERVGLAMGDGLGGEHYRRLAFVAHRGRRLLVVGDRLSGVDHLRTAVRIAQGGLDLACRAIDAQAYAAGEHLVGSAHNLGDAAVRPLGVERNGD
jgi:hypothetical protein